MVTPLEASETHSEHLPADSTVASEEGSEESVEASVDSQLPVSAVDPAASEV